MSKKTKDPWVRIIDVTDPLLHDKGYTLYKVISKVFPKNSVEAVTEVTVWKRYNDFKKLHKALSTLHQNLYLKDTFPPFAKTQFFGRFDPSVIEERRKSALALLQFAANCSPLFTSQVFVKFFEDGHHVEKPTPISTSQTKSSPGILQPQKSFLPPEIIEKRLCESKEESNGHENQDSVLKEPFVSLGGIWQHHQVPDNISLGSHGTDDDDHTTFTDDDSTVSRPSINLSEFDPILSNNNSTGQDFLASNQENMCNSWLLSALQSCSSTDVERDLENILEFPTPFHDFEAPEDYMPTSNESHRANSFNSDLKENHFTFDSPTPVAEISKYVSEFDPVLNNSQPDIPKEAPCDEEDSYNYDRFAMTPSAYEKEPSRRPSYIINASKHVRFAQEAEAETNYKEAFDLYKKAIDVLLQGFQKDKCPELKEIVRKKVLLYLMRAEELYETKLPKDNFDVKVKIEKPCLPFPPGNLVTKLQGNVEELQKYKVLGVLDKVLLVLDISTNNTFIVKTLYKSSSPQAFGSAHIVPQNVPFVVKLYRIYETNYALFLILEHATGGRLWDYVSSFLQRSPLSPCNDGTCLYVESKTKVDLCNVYSGKKVSDGNDVGNTNSETLVDPDLTPSEKCPSSYVALFKKYADTVDQEENVSLAKYHKLQLVTSKGKGSEVTDMIESINDINKKMTLLQPQKNIRNRLSSSTGSLETTFSQKPSNLDALNAMDKAASQTSMKTHLPESCINLWAAEIVLALDSLHNLGIIWMDFHPDNILLGAEGHILLTYQSQWKNIDFVINKTAKENLFCAPEVGNIFPVSPDCDWWSLGAILFELLTGQSLVSCHPTGITRHTVLNFPTDISSNAKDFVSKLLQYNPTERLGSGIYGIEEIKSHPFLRNIDWKALHS